MFNFFIINSTMLEELSKYKYIDFKKIKLGEFN